MGAPVNDAPQSNSDGNLNELQPSLTCSIHCSRAIGRCQSVSGRAASMRPRIGGHHQVRASAYLDAPCVGSEIGQIARQRRARAAADAFSTYLICTKDKFRTRQPFPIRKVYVNNNLYRGPMIAMGRIKAVPGVPRCHLLSSLQRCRAREARQHQTATRLRYYSVSRNISLNRLWTRP
jgi:hypothetical protein